MLGNHERDASGWCPHQVDHVAEVYDDIGLQELAFLDRTLRAVDHEPCTKTTQCIAFNTDLENYNLRHTESCAAGAGSGCQMVRVPYQELIRTVNAGYVPLISIRDSPKHGLSFRVHRRRFVDTYASVSHVWADGLGNPEENALPSCQVKQLQFLQNYDCETKDWLE